MVNGLLQPGMTVSRSILTRIVTGAAIAVVCCATAAEAQRERGVEAVGGLSLGGAHQRTGFVGTLRYHRHSPNGLTVVPQITVIHMASRVPDRSAFGIAEVFGAQEVTQKRLRPVIGGGAGIVVCCGGLVRPTLHAMEGFEFDLDRRWTLQFEIRQRTLPQQTPSFEMAVGATARLSSPRGPAASDRPTSRARLP